jgi:phosphoribosylformylglycinamidine synthase
MTFGVLIFPGSNCDRDALYATSLAAGTESRPLWHKDTAIPPDVDCVIVPGGFSYGDYLRCGAIARFSPIMQDVARFAERGGVVMGICNGFQILCEAGLLPGALLRNSSLHFVCRDVHLRVERTDTPFTNAVTKSVLRVPIAHGEGAYYADDDTLNALEANGQVLVRYCDAQGAITPEANPNGSLRNIAGVMNKRGNVFGLMPHPERACEAVLGSDDGMMILRSLVEAVIPA